MESNLEAARLERQARTYIHEAGGGVDLSPDFGCFYGENKIHKQLKHCYL